VSADLWTPAEMALGLALPWIFLALIRIADALDEDDEGEP